MPTSVQDYQPAMTSGTTAVSNFGRMTSRPAGRKGSISDPESAMSAISVAEQCSPPTPPPPPPPRQQTSGSVTTVDHSVSLDESGAEPRHAVLHRIPTYLQPPLSWRERLLHFTFAWYTVTMSTSGIAMVIALTPHRFTGLSTIGLIIFLLDLLAFLFITAMIILRFVMYQHTFRRAFTRPHEALFISTLWLSICAMLLNIDEYSRIFLSPSAYLRLAPFMRVAFWIYLTVTFMFSVFQYHLLFTVKEERRLSINAMTPAWILPIFPVMLAGSLAGTCAKSQPAVQALEMISAGLAAQGLGILVSMFYYSTYLSRLMAFGLPVQRPGMFIAVGPPSFTCSALVAMAGEVPRILVGLPVIEVITFSGGDPGVSIRTLGAMVRLLAITTAVFLWGLSFWFFASATAAVVAGMPDRKFHLSWWSFVFPNVGFTLACIRMGRVLESEGILWFGTVMTVLLVVAWGFISYRCAVAVYRREIVWPGHDEDSL
ncbi:voltage-dependent anion channel-domain-containing protein [Triangularia verruculosa]|uniref:Voltage-dependent anion channel-domain-containing protein n=1 Tax=Triangularia verruculosa TaxID=2587418 RepID=A0AAN6XQH5_9PEZI|nr:voltage-dependent anion channel-domain-containing protein [Triangularia verruculosa]